VNVSRRRLLAGLSAVALAGTAIAGTAPRAAAQSVNVAELHKPGPLGDKILGSDKAAVTIVEYASVTCPACAAFHTETYPTLKKKYIDTGKIRFIFREFPTNPAQVATAGFMLAHCSGDKYFPLVEVLFEQQKSWFKNPLEGFKRIAKQAGFTEQSFETCLQDNKLRDEILQVAKRGQDGFGVKSTPTFFINGLMAVGVLSVSEMEKLIDPLLK